MKRMLFNATHSEELRVAIVDGQTLLDLDIETLGKEQRKGNIYTGIITRIEPSLEACFVDYGVDRHGFLPFKEVSRAYFQNYEGGRVRIQDVLKEGMQLIVQVEKDERGNKGAALTTFISLAGRYLVLMPNNPRGGGVSRRIEGEERAELKEAMSQLDVPYGMSIIARTAGIGRTTEELQWDFNYLLQLWRAIENAAAVHKNPYLLFMESSLVIRAIRDYYRPDIGEILIDNPEVYEQVSEFMSYVMPNNLSKLKLYEEHIPLFSRLQIEQQIESAFSRSVNLPSGGAIVIDHTEALVSIDVNSARATRGADIEETAFRTNMEAVEEITRQMRLRDLGGLVVIDFIDMEDPAHQRDIENTLRDALKKDRARIQMGKLSRFGLLELSRQRLQPALNESSHITCPRCAGTGVIRSIESTALHVLRLIQDAAMKDNTGEVHAQVPVDVATFLLNEKRAELFGMEERLNVSILLIPNTNFENPRYEISRIRVDDVDENPEASYKRVSKPEPQQTLFANNKGEKVTRPEPAVKGIKHDSPAPAANKSLWAGFKAWLSNLFSGSHQADEEKSKKDNKQSKRTNHTTNKRNNPNRRQNKRRTEQTPEQATKPSVQNHEPTQPITTPEVPPVQQEKTTKNNRRREKVATETQGNNVTTNNVNTATQPEKAERRNNRKQSVSVNDNKRERNNRSNRHAQEKRRNIPSAVKIEKYLDLNLAALLVEDAVQHVLEQSTPKQPVLPEAESTPANIIVENQQDNANSNQLIIQAANAINQAVEAIQQQSQADVTKIAEPSTSTIEVSKNDENTATVSTSPATPSEEPVTSWTTAIVEKPVQETHQLTEPVILTGISNDIDDTDKSQASSTITQFQDLSNLNLNGLVLIETSPEALRQWENQPEPTTPSKLRRKDCPKPQPAIIHTEMIQIETLKEN